MSTKITISNSRKPSGTATVTSKALIPRNERAAHMVYLGGANEAQISKALGVKSATVSEWRKRPEWSEAVARLRDHQEKLVLDRLALLTKKATDAIEESLENSNPAVRLKAAQWVLDRGLEISGIRSSTTEPMPPGEIEQFIQMVTINVGK